MRRLLPLAATLVLAACGAPSQWEKPGVDQAAAQHDNQECRSAAQREAFTLGPYAAWGRFPVFSGWPGFRRGLWPGGYWYNPAPGYWVSPLYWETDRLLLQDRLTAFCMRNRGYELVTVGENRDR